MAKKELPLGDEKTLRMKQRNEDEVSPGPMVLAILCLQLQKVALKREARFETPLTESETAMAVAETMTMVNEFLRLYSEERITEEFVAEFVAVAWRKALAFNEETKKLERFVPFCGGSLKQDNPLE